MKLLVCLVIAALSGCFETGSMVTLPDGGAAVCETPDWCTEAGDACTFCASIGDSCNVEVTNFCALGLGWCSSGTCNSVCNPVAYPHCGKGMTEHLVAGTPPNDTVCICSPD